MHRYLYTIRLAKIAIYSYNMVMDTRPPTTPAVKVDKFIRAQPAKIYKWAYMSKCVISEYVYRFNACKGI